MISSACRYEKGGCDVPVCKLGLTNGAGVVISKTDSKIACYKRHNETKQADSNVLVPSSNAVQVEAIKTC